MVPVGRWLLTDRHNFKTSRLKVQFCSIMTKIINIYNFLSCANSLTFFNNVKNALNPVFCKGVAAFNHLPGGGILGRFFQLGSRSGVVMVQGQGSSWFKVRVIMVICVGVSIPSSLRPQCTHLYPFIQLAIYSHHGNFILIYSLFHIDH